MTTAATGDFPILTRSLSRANYEVRAMFLETFLGELAALPVARLAVRFAAEPLPALAALATPQRTLVLHIQLQG